MAAFEVNVTHVESEGPFLQLWFQKDFGSGEAIEKVLNDSRIILNSESGAKNIPEQFNIDQIVLVKLNIYWYRGKVIEINKPQCNTLEIHLIDYGNTVSVALEDIRYIEPLIRKDFQILKIPGLASKALVSGVIAKAATWSDEIIEEISSKCLKLCVIQVQNSTRYISFATFKVVESDEDIGNVITQLGYGNPIQWKDQFSAHIIYYESQIQQLQSTLQQEAPPYQAIQYQTPPSNLPVHVQFPPPNQRAQFQLAPPNQPVQFPPPNQRAQFQLAPPNQPVQLSQSNQRAQFQLAPPNEPVQLSQTMQLAPPNQPVQLSQSNQSAQFQLAPTNQPVPTDHLHQFQRKLLTLRPQSQQFRRVQLQSNESVQYQPMLANYTVQFQPTSTNQPQFRQPPPTNQCLQFQHAPQTFQYQSPTSTQFEPSMLMLSPCASSYQPKDFQTTHFQQSPRQPAQHEQHETEIQQGLKKDSNTFQLLPLLPIGSHHEVEVSYIEDGPHCFYIHLLSDMKDFNKMTCELVMEQVVPLKSISVGTGCLSLLKKNDSQIICRAIIMPTNNTPKNMCLVYYIDHGNSAVVHVTSLYELPLKYQYIKPFALNFMLSSSDTLPEIYDPKTFDELVSTKDNLKMIVTPAVGSSAKQYCELYIDDMNVLDLLMEKIQSPIKYTETQLEVNVEYMVNVSFIDTSGDLPWHFYVQLNNDLSKLDLLMTEVGKHCASIPTSQTINAETNEAIFAKYEEDGQWYRALVWNKHSNNLATVLFIDYGNLQDVDASATKPVNPDLIIKKPACAIRCRLQSADTVEVGASLFSEMTEGKIVKLKVVQKLTSGEILVRIIDTTTQPPRDLNFEILAAVTPHLEVSKPITSPLQVQVHQAPLMSQTLLIPAAKWRHHFVSNITSTGPQISGVRQQKLPGFDTTDCTEVEKHARKPSIVEHENTQIPIKPKPNDKQKKRIAGGTKMDEHMNEAMKIKDKDDSSWKRGQQKIYEHGKSPDPNDSGKWLHDKFESDTTAKDVCSEPRKRNYREKEKWTRGEQISKEGLFKSRGIQDENSSRRNESDRPKTGGSRDDNSSRRSNSEQPKTGGFRDDNISPKNESERPKAGGFGDGNNSRRSDSEHPKTRGFRDDNIPQKNESECPKAGGFGDGNNSRRSNPERLKTGGFGNDNISRRSDSERPKAGGFGDGNNSRRSDSERPKTGGFRDNNISRRSDSERPKTGGFGDDNSSLRSNPERLKTGGFGNDNISRRNDSERPKTGGFRDNNIFRRGDSERPKTGGFRGEKDNFSRNSESEHPRFGGFGREKSSFIKDKSFKPPGFEVESKHNESHTSKLSNPQRNIDCVENWDDDEKGNLEPQQGVSGINSHNAEKINASCGSGGKRLGDSNKHPNTSQELSVKPTVMNDAEETWDTPTAVKTKFFFTKLQLVPGTKLEAYTIFLANPSDFYVQLKMSVEKLEQLMEKVAELCAVSTISMQESDLDPSNACLAKFSEDDTWYRAQVLSLTGQKVKVKFVDYGNTEEVEIQTSVKAINSELSELPAQAINCTLRGVKPAGGDSWTQEELDKFTEAVGDKDLEVELVAIEGLQLMQFSVVVREGTTCINELFGASPSSLLPCNQLAQAELDVGSTYEVFISWFLSPGNFHVQHKDRNEEQQELYKEFQYMDLPNLESVQQGNLVMAQCPLPKEKEFYRGCVLATRDNKARVYNLDTGAIQVCEVSKLRPMPESVKGIPALAIHCELAGVVPKPGPDWPLSSKPINQVFQSSPNFIMNIKSRDKDGKISVSLVGGGLDVAEKLVNNGLASDIKLTIEETVLDDKQNEDQLIPGSSCSVSVCYLEGLSFSVHELANEEILDSMQEQLQDMVEDMLEVPQDFTGLVAAKRVVDGKWYRALPVAEVTKEGTLVCLVDYGCEEQCSQLRQLPTDLIDLPYFATACRLAVKPCNNHYTFSQEAINKFQDLVIADEIEITAKVYAKWDDTLVVDLMIDGEKSVIDILCSDQLANSAFELAYVSNVESLNSFYMQMVSDESKIHEIEDRLFTEEFETIEKLDVGMLCITQFTEDEAWYRSEVTSVNDNETVVRFIDYGNSAVATKFKKLPEDMASIAPLAKACCLKDVPTTEVEINQLLDQVMDGTVQFRVLSLETAATPLKVKLIKNNRDIMDKSVKPVRSFNAIINQTRTKEMTEEKLEIKEEHKTEEIVRRKATENLKSDLQEVYISYYNCPSKLWYQKTNEEDKLYDVQERLMTLTTETIDAVTVGNLYAAMFSDDKGWYRGQVVSVDPLDVFFIDFGNIGQADELKPLPEDLIILPPLATCCSLKSAPENEEMCLKLKETLSDEFTKFQLKHLKDNLVTIYKENLNVFELIGYKPEPELTEFVISFYESPSRFFVQLSSDLEKLDDIQATIKNNAEPLLESVDEGVHYLAKFTDDESWYRAQVTSVEANVVEVFFYDYGNSSSATEFKRMSDDMIKIPAMAQLCNLADLPEKLSECMKEKLDGILSDPLASFQAIFPEVTNGSSINLTIMKDSQVVIEMVKDDAGDDEVPQGNDPDITIEKERETVKNENDVEDEDNQKSGENQVNELPEETTTKTVAESESKLDEISKTAENASTESKIAELTGDAPEEPHIFYSQSDEELECAEPTEVLQVTPESEELCIDTKTSEQLSVAASMLSVMQSEEHQNEVKTLQKLSREALVNTYEFGVDDNVPLNISEEDIEKLMSDSSITEELESKTLENSQEKDDKTTYKDTEESMSGTTSVMPPVNTEDLQDQNATDPVSNVIPLNEQNVEDDISMVTSESSFDPASNESFSDENSVDEVSTSIVSSVNSEDCDKKKPTDLVSNEPVYDEDFGEQHATKIASDECSTADATSVVSTANTEEQDGERHTGSVSFETPSDTCSTTDATSVASTANTEDHNVQRHTGSVSFETPSDECSTSDATSVASTANTEEQDGERHTDTASFETPFDECSTADATSVVSTANTEDQDVQRHTGSVSFETPSDECSTADATSVASTANTEDQDVQRHTGSVSFETPPDECSTRDATSVASTANTEDQDVQRHTGSVSFETPSDECSTRDATSVVSTANTEEQDVQRHTGSVSFETPSDECITTDATSVASTANTEEQDGERHTDTASFETPFDECSTRDATSVASTANTEDFDESTCSVETETSSETSTDLTGTTIILRSAPDN